MKTITSLAEAEATLATFIPRKKDTKSYSLERMYKLMNFLGNPQNKLRVIHVAGTSGKTSTSYYAAALLQAVGKTVGLSISPHVTAVNERAQVNLEPLPEPKFRQELNEFLKLIGKSGVEPSYFELLVAFAYWEFAKLKLDYAVMEVGLGGLLDGTNVVKRQDKVCIITDIGLDHVNILGETLPEIAAQKAGIIQNGNVVFCHRQAKEILEVFRGRAEQQSAKLHIIEPEIVPASLSFLPLFQQRNFSLARATVDFALKRDGHQPLSANNILQAAKILIPARMEIVKRADKIIIMDGAHNAQKLQALSESIKAKFPGQKIAALVSFVDGRGYRIKSSLDELAKLTNTLIVTSFLNAAQDLPYGPIKTEHLAKLAREHDFTQVELVDNPHQAFRKLLTCPEPILLITGSFYLMDDLRVEVIQT